MGSFLSKLFGGSKSKDGTPTSDGHDDRADSRPLLPPSLKSLNDLPPGKGLKKDKVQTTPSGRPIPQIAAPPPPPPKVTLPGEPRVYTTTYETTITPSPEVDTKIVAPLATIEVDADITEYSRDVTPAPEEVENAVVKIQAGVRGFLTRKNLKDKMESNKDFAPPPPEFNDVVMGEEPQIMGEEPQIMGEGISTVQKCFDPDGKLSRTSSPVDVPQTNPTFSSNRKVSDDIEVLPDFSPSSMCPISSQINSVVMSFISSQPVESVTGAVKSLANQLVSEATESANDVMSRSIVSLEEPEVEEKSQSRETTDSTVKITGNLLVNPHNVTNLFPDGLPPPPERRPELEKGSERRKSLAEKLTGFAMESIARVGEVLTQVMSPRSEEPSIQSIPITNPSDVTHMWPKGIQFDQVSLQQTWEEKRKQFQENEQIWQTVMEKQQKSEEEQEKAMETLSTEDQAAVRIQAAYRGYQVRKNISRDVSPQPPTNHPQSEPQQSTAASESVVVVEEKEQRQPRGSVDLILDDENDFLKQLEGKLELLDSTSDVTLTREDSHDSITREAIKQSKEELDAEEKRQQELDQLLDLLSDTHAPEEFDDFLKDDEDDSQADVFAKENVREVVTRTSSEGSGALAAETLPPIPPELLSDPFDPTDFVVPDPPAAQVPPIPDERNLSKSKRRGRKQGRQESTDQQVSSSPRESTSSQPPSETDFVQSLMTDRPIPTIDIRKASSVAGDFEMPLSASSFDSPETPYSPTTPGGDDEEDGEEPQVGFVRGTSPNPFGGRKKRRRNKGKSKGQ